MSVGTVLVVDDNPTNLKLISVLLRTQGYSVRTATSADEAWISLQEQLPDLVLMDVVLPGMSGFQATRALTRDAATSKIPVLIVSTKSMETDRAWGMRQGAVDYVVKPPREEDLLERINQLVTA